MRALAEWLSSREPPPPEKLEASLRALPWERLPAASSAVAPNADELGPLEALAHAGRERLEHALAHAGRERESAFKLLEADALFTYACEAALEAEDPEAALHRILTVAGR